MTNQKHRALSLVLAAILLLAFVPGTFAAELSDTAQPAFSVELVYGGKNVSISCTTAGATIYYTLDGSTPTTASTVYREPIEFRTAGSTLVRTIAVKDGVQSAVRSGNVTVEQVAAPTLAQQETLASGAKRITLQCATADAEIFYVPYASSSSATVSLSDQRYVTPITLAQSGYLVAVAVKKGCAESAALRTNITASGTMVAEPSVTSYRSGHARVLTIDCDTEGAEIYYTLDNYGPNPRSTRYTEPFTVNAVGTYIIRVYAIKDGLGDSPVIARRFTVDDQLYVAPITASVQTESSGIKNVSLQTETSNVAIYYTTDGSDPTTSETARLYESAIRFSTAGTYALRVAGTRVGYVTATRQFQVTVTLTTEDQVQTPRYAAATNADGSKYVSIACDTEGATIHYTIGGAAPTTSDPVYEKPILFNTNGVHRIRAIAVKAGMLDSAIRSADVTVAMATVATPTLQTALDSTGEVTVTLNCTSDQAQIYYTTNGVIPTAQTGTLYTAPFTLRESGTYLVQAIAVKDSLTSALMSVSVPVNITVTPTAATPTLTVTEELGGKAVTMTTTTNGASIYYTTDQSTPSRENGTRYTAPVLLTQNTVIKAVTVHSAYLDSETATTTVKVSPAAAVTASPASGTALDLGSAVTLRSATQDAEIYYTLDGTTPTIHSTRYEAPIVLTQDTTIRAISVASGYAASSAGSFSYTMKRVVLSADALAAYHEGDGAQLALRLSGNTGFASMRITVRYDAAALTATTVEAGTVLGASPDMTLNTSTPGTAIINILNSNNFTGDGALLLLHFTTNSAGVDALPLEVVCESVFDKDYNAVSVSAPGTVTMRRVLPGDVYADSAVDNRDGVKYLQYLAQFQSLTFSEYELLAADIFSDGARDGKDYLLLKRYLAGYSVDQIPDGALSSLESAKLSLTAEERDGQLFVSVDMTENTGIAYWNCELGFDRSVLSPVSVTLGSAFGGTLGTNLHEVGVDLSALNKVTAVWQSNENVSATGNVLNFVFDLVGDGAYGLDLRSLQMIDVDTMADVTVEVAQAPTLMAESALTLTNGTLQGAVTANVAGLSADCTPELILAVYEDGALIHTERVTPDATQATIALNVDGVSSDATARLMLWQDMKALAKAIELPIV